MCIDYNDAIDYLSAQCSNWSGSDKTVCETAISVIEDSGSTELQKEEAMEDLNDLYWNCTQVTDRSCFGQNVFVVSRTVDPGKPVPVKI